MVSPLCQPPGVCTQAIITLLPLFRDGAHSPAIMNLVRQIICQVNPEQIPVFTVDQSLYAIAKIIQWKWPDEMGGLHIERAMLKVIGIWLDRSGLTYVMTSDNVTTEGRTTGLIKGAHISRVSGDTYQ